MVKISRAHTVVIGSTLIALFAVGAALYVRYGDEDGAALNYKRDGGLSTAGTSNERLQDSDGDGLADWEEALWQTDPTKADTDGNGVSDKEEVAKQKAALAVVAEKKDEVGTTLTSATVQDAVEIFVSQKDGSLSEAERAALTANFAAQIKASPYVSKVEPAYAMSDLKLTDSSREHTDEYLTALLQTFNSFIESYPGDDEIFLEEFVVGRHAQADVTARAERYKNMAAILADISVPVAASETHLELINTYEGIATAFTNISFTREDALRGITGLMQLQAQLERLDTVRLELHSFFST